MANALAARDSRSRAIVDPALNSRRHIVPRPLFATIHLPALRHNLAVVRRCAPRSRVLAVVKANAYGHGLLRGMRAFEAAEGLALIEVDGAVRLRENGWTKRILLLEGWFKPADLPVLAAHRIATAVHCEEQLAMLDAAPPGTRLDILVKVNTGMNRLGFAPGVARAVIDRVRAHRAVAQVTLMTHFANADDAKGVDWQLAVLDREFGAETLPRSLANSAAILRHPRSHHDWVRPGIMLYGCSPLPDQHGAQLDLQPAMTLASEIIAVQHLRRGDTVGYGGTFTAENAMRIGVVACGYADGYPRHAPTGTPVHVAGRLTRTLGRVSMDMLCVDLSAIPDAGVGAPVELWGAGNPVEHVAKPAGTVGYELLCALAPRVPVMEEA